MKNTRNLGRVFGLILFGWLIGIGSPVMGEEEASSKSKYIDYVELKPAFVLNYGDMGSRLKYFKAEVSVRVGSKQDADNVRAHSDYIRNQLVFLFSRQDDKAFSSVAGKEALRQEALAEVQKLMEEETGRKTIEDLLFTSFIVQK